VGRSNLHSIPIDDPIECALTAPLCGAGRCGGNAAPYTPYQKTENHEATDIKKKSTEN